MAHRLNDVALADVMMEGMDGHALMAQIKRRDAAADVLMMTGGPAVAAAVRALTSRGRTPHRRLREYHGE